MSIFQKTVDALIKKELESIKKAKIDKEKEAKDIYKKETTQSKINDLIEKQNKENDKK